MPPQFSKPALAKLLKPYLPIIYGYLEDLRRLRYNLSTHKKEEL
jgi:hypothetical protein